MSSISKNPFTIECLVSKGAKLPVRANATDAGADLFALIPEGFKTLEIYPNEQLLVDTGIAVKIPVGYVGHIEMRSSQRVKGITSHGTGIIDSDYRGNLKVLLKNTGDSKYIIDENTKIGQLVVVPIILSKFVDCWNDTDRGSGGFGSTDSIQSYIEGRAY